MKMDVFEVSRYNHCGEPPLLGGTCGMWLSELRGHDPQEKDLFSEGIKPLVCENKIVHTVCL